MTRIKPRPRRPEWHPTEIAVLIEGYGHQPIGILATRLKRTKQAIRTKARDMGLQGERREPKIPDHTPCLKATMPHDVRVSDDWEQTTDARLGSLRLLKRLMRYHPQGFLDLSNWSEPERFAIVNLWREMDRAEKRQRIGG